MKKIMTMLAIIAAVLSISACKNQNRKPILPSISGKAGEVLIVINKEYWEGDTGNTLRDRGHLQTSSRFTGTYS